MLTSLRLENFKGHVSSTVPLQKLTVLVGPNGSGKTSVLQAIRLLGQMARGTHVEAAAKDLGDGSWDSLRRVRSSATSVAVRGMANGHSYGLSLSEEWSPATSTQERGEPTTAYLSGSAQHGQRNIRWFFDDYQGKDDGVLFRLPDPRAEVAIDRNWTALLQTASIFKFDPSIIAAPASSQQPWPRVEFDGRNAAVALKAMKLGHDEQWAVFRELLRKIVPNVENIGVEQVEKVDPGQYPSASSLTAPAPSGEWYRIFFDFKGAKHIPAYHASEGTLMTVALLATLLGQSGPRLVLIDDIEQTLHPAAQLELMKQLKDLLAQDEMRDVQIIATTHSPYILDGLDYEQVQVFALREDGAAVTRSLSEHPDAAEVRGTMNAGELWSSDPEWSWVVSQEK
jgi:predicted ATPase